MDCWKRSDFSFASFNFFGPWSEVFTELPTATRVAWAGHRAGGRLTQSRACRESPWYAIPKSALTRNFKSAAERQAAAGRRVRYFRVKSASRGDICPSEIGASSVGRGIDFFAKVTGTFTPDFNRETRPRSCANKVFVQAETQWHHRDAAIAMAPLKSTKHGVPGRKWRNA